MLSGGWGARGNKLSNVKSKATHTYRIQFDSPQVRNDVNTQMKCIRNQNNLITTMYMCMYVATGGLERVCHD